MLGNIVFIEVYILPSTQKSANVMPAKRTTRPQSSSGLSDDAARSEPNSSSVQAQLASLRSYLEDSAVSAAKFDRWAEEIAREVKDVKNVTMELKAALAELHVQLDFSRQELIKKETALEATQRQLDSAWGRIRQMELERDDATSRLKAEVHALRHSLSWRVTAPLRYSLSTLIWLLAKIGISVPGYEALSLHPLHDSQKAHAHSLKQLTPRARQFFKRLQLAKERQYRRGL